MIRCEIMLFKIDIILNFHLFQNLRRKKPTTQSEKQNIDILQLYEYIVQFNKSQIPYILSSLGWR